MVHRQLQEFSLLFGGKSREFSRPRIGIATDRNCRSQGAVALCQCGDATGILRRECAVGGLELLATLSLVCCLQLRALSILKRARYALNRIACATGGRRRIATCSVRSAFRFSRAPALGLSREPVTGPAPSLCSGPALPNNAVMARALFFQRFDGGFDGAGIGLCIDGRLPSGSASALRAASLAISLRTSGGVGATNLRSHQQDSS